MKVKLFWNKKDKQKEDLVGLELPDGFKIIFFEERKETILAFPKKKFSENFKKQIEDKKYDNITISFSEEEIEALYEGLEKMKEKRDFIEKDREKPSKKVKKKLKGENKKNENNNK